MANLAFLKADGSTVTQSETLAPTSVKRLRVDDISGLANTAVSTVVTTTGLLPLVAERSMFWDSRYYGGHTEKAADAPSTRWFFAEGSQGFFDTYVLLANSNAQP